ncbi:MAG TPA: SulP family inorganic anion transporter [Burkholderiaceae bacterium]|nr:SulP family inorganic anion transporter [Burkholderiaceae bacterium]
MVDLHPFRPRLLDSLRSYDRSRLVHDIGAGISVGIVALPLAMAFAIASGVKPEQGIITAIVAGFLISALGGSSVQIGGPAGAFIVIVYGIVQRYGLTNLLIATALAGVLMFALGLLKLGALVRYVPVAVVIGFTNGIAVLIALSQLRDLFGLEVPGALPADFFGLLGTLAAHAGSVSLHALGIGLATFVGLMVWPRLFAGTLLPSALLEGRTVRAFARVPGPVVALVTMTALVWWFTLPVETIGTRFGGIPRTLPDLALPPFSWESAKQLLIPTVTIALLGAIESLLCARVADNLTTQPRHDPNQELMAQGVANFVTPFFGGIPATGTIARTVTNVRAGATSPVAGIVHAATLLVVVLLAAPLAMNVPLASLAGILLYVAWNMGEWHEFGRLKRFSNQYRTILVGTFALTVVFDLTVAVQVGLILACLFFIYRMGTLFRVQPPAEQTPLPPGVQVFELFGSLFFGAVGKIESLPAQIKPDTRAVVLEMHRLISMDTSGLDALQQFHRALMGRGIALVLANVNEQPLSLIRRSGFEQVLGPEQIVPTVSAAFDDEPQWSVSDRH